MALCGLVPGSILGGYHWLANLRNTTCQTRGNQRGLRPDPTVTSGSRWPLVVARPTISAGPVPLSPSSCSNIGDIAEYAIPSLSFPFAITAGPDGNLWFTELDAGNIGRICAKKNVAENCSAIGAITEYPAQGQTPVGITAAPDGQLWFTTVADGYIRSINTAGVVTGSYALPKGEGERLSTITAGPDGALWFTGVRYPNPYIGRICVEVSSSCPYIGALTDPPYLVS